MTTITCVGLGINVTEDLTRKATEALGDRSAVNLLLCDSGIQSALEAINIRGQNISHLYGNGDSDLGNYERILAEVMQQAENSERVNLAVPGHPEIGVTVTALLRKECAKRGIAFDLVPGISSFDRMICELGIDPIDRGTNLLDANRILLFKKSIDPTSSSFIYHVCSTGNSKAWYKDPNNGNRLELLQDYLVRTYGSKHPCTFIMCNTNSSRKSNLITTELGLLTNHRDHITFLTTLFVPAAKPTSVDRSFLRLLQQGATR
jgi:hypothetical protein